MALQTKSTRPPNNGPYMKEQLLEQTNAMTMETTPSTFNRWTYDGPQFPIYTLSWWLHLKIPATSPPGALKHIAWTSSTAGAGCWRLIRYTWGGACSDSHRLQKIYERITPKMITQLTFAVEGHVGAMR